MKRSALTSQRLRIETQSFRQADATATASVTIDTPLWQVQGVSVPSLNTWEGHRLSLDRTRQGASVLVTAGRSEMPIIDLQGLKAAAEAYQISSNPRDYVFTEVPANNADLPNRNGDGFPLEELLLFRPILGMMAYQSYRMKQTNQDHNNKDPRTAKGIILDASMVKTKGHWGVRVIACWDRQKDPKLAGRILAGKDAGYSMACLITSAECSNCGNIAKGGVTCKCINGGAGKMTIAANGNLIYEKVRGLNFWELSHVEDRADFDASAAWRA